MPHSGRKEGITARSYKSGSVVYFDGDRSEYIYILKSGRIILSYLKPESGEELKEEIKPGEFFGVKSALGKYPREETAQTFGDTSVLVLTVMDFEKLVLGNVQVVKKMLRVFSNQLRRIGRAEREVLGETNTVNPQTELFKIGEYYYKAGKYDQALYAYKKYMEYYPDSTHAATSMQRIKDLQTGNIKPLSDGSNDSSHPADFPAFPDSFDNDAPDNFGSDEPDNFGPSTDMTDFDFDDGPGGGGEISNEMDDFLNNDSFSGSATAGKTLDSINNLIRARNFEKALDELENLTQNGGLSAEDSAHAGYYEGVCLFETGKLKEALNAFSNVIKQNESPEFMKKSLLQVGLIYKKTGNNDKAKAYLSKVVSIQPSDETTQSARSYLSEIG
ncbi:MAG: cyclic nucleotide-binding domain-containing protein [Spirochaetes bacterium]|nr:cyclic nucleotide-binding domain-containing protein [Spirochaetota bacterium]